MLEIEVVYGLTHTQKLYILNVAEGTTARQALLQSPLPNDFPEVDFHTLPLGIFGKAVPEHTILRQYDRVEAYRTLLVNPKEARRLRAARKQQENEENQ